MKPVPECTQPETGGMVHLSARQYTKHTTNTKLEWLQDKFLTVLSLTGFGLESQEGI